MFDLADETLRLVRLYGPFAVALFTFLESSLLFPFLPSEVVVPAAAAAVVTGPASFAVFVAAAGIGGTAGAFVPFYAFRGRGSSWLGRVEDSLHVSEDARDRAREWFADWGVTSVLWGRFLPGLRSVVSVPAGVVGMRPGAFGALTAVGTVGFYATVAAVVYVGRERSVYHALATVAVERPLLAALAFLGVLAVAAALTRWYHRRGGSSTAA